MFSYLVRSIRLCKHSNTLLTPCSGFKQDNQPCSYTINDSSEPLFMEKKNVEKTMDEIKK